MIPFMAKNYYMEYNVSYVYLAMHTYLNKDNVALMGFAKFSSLEERQHVEKLLDYQLKCCSIIFGSMLSFKYLVPFSLIFRANKETKIYAAVHADASIRI